MFFRNVGKVLSDYTALHPRRQYSSNHKYINRIKRIRVWNWEPVRIVNTQANVNIYSVAGMAEERSRRH
jgi:hypothetical protein